MVQCVTAAGLFGAGDVIAQQLVERKGLKGHDVSSLYSYFSLHVVSSLGLPNPSQLHV
jgi:hypothetical protein